jgi:mono/diheme cytochrome c family protein
MRAKYWLLAIAFVITASGIVTMRWLRRGFSARDQPSTIEQVIARRVRSWAVPTSVRDATNPVRLTPEVLADARAHFADHCASCHANDGSGNTTIGQNLYPKAPDMRLDATQRLTDGELYAIIQNGIRLTGMPAWGKEGDEYDADSWKCVHLIRHLNELTPEQLIEMKHMNPKSPDEIQEEKEEAEFLRGGEPNEEHPSHGQHQH